MQEAHTPRKISHQKFIIAAIFALALWGVLELCSTLNKIFRDAAHSNAIAREIYIHSATQDYYRTHKKYPGNLTPNMPMPCLLKKASNCRTDAQLVADNRAFWTDLSVSETTGAQGYPVPSALHKIIGENDFYFSDARLGEFVIMTTDGHSTPDHAAPGAKAPPAGLLLLLTDINTLTLQDRGAGEYGLTPNEAASFDRKLDDGRPDTGLIRAIGAPECFAHARYPTESPKNLLYDERLNDRVCDLIFSFGDIEKP